MLIYFDMLPFLLQDFMVYRSDLMSTTGTWMPRNSDQFLRYVLQCNGQLTLKGCGRATQTSDLLITGHFSCYLRRNTMCAENGIISNKIKSK